MHEPLNPNANTPINLSPASVAEPPSARHGATEFGRSSEDPSSAAKGEMDNTREPEADLVQQQKKAKKDKKREDRQKRDAAVTASLAQTQHIGTPRDAGTRSWVRKTCMDGLKPTGPDGQAAVGQDVFTNPGSGERHAKKRTKAQRNGVLDRLEQASRQRVRLPVEEPESGRQAGRLATLFAQAGNYLRDTPHSGHSSGQHTSAGTLTLPFVGGVSWGCAAMGP